MVAPPRFGTFLATAPDLSPQAQTFLRAVAPAVRRALWDEIDEIGHNPIGRGTLVEDPERDPEMASMRYALGVPGYAIFYVPLPHDRVYVTRIQLWDFDAFLRS